MFGIGFWELILIFVLALIIFGPEKLPKIASDLGKAYFDLRRTMEEVKRDIKEDIKEAEITKDFDTIKEAKNELNNVISRPVDFVISQDIEEEQQEDKSESKEDKSDTSEKSENSSPENVEDASKTE